MKTVTEKLTPVEDLRLKIEKYIHHHGRHFKQFSNKLNIDLDLLYQMETEPESLKNHLFMLPYSFGKNSIRIKCRQIESNKAEIKVYDFEGNQLTRSKQIWMHEDFNEIDLLVFSQKVIDPESHGAAGYKSYIEKFMINAAAIDEDVH